MERFLGISLGDGTLEILFLVLLTLIGVAIGVCWPLGDKKNGKKNM